MLTKGQRDQFQLELDALMDKYDLVGVDRVACFTVNLITACLESKSNPLEVVTKGMVVHMVDLIERTG